MSKSSEISIECSFKILNIKPGTTSVIVNKKSISKTKKSPKHVKYDENTKINVYNTVADDILNDQSFKEDA